MKPILAASLVGALAVTGTQAAADNKLCYWNADGLPYSKAPPQNAGEVLFAGGPGRALFALLMEAPQLLIKPACGNVVEADLIRPREVYRSWGCAPDSSMAQMIEGLASGGAFVSPAMSFLEYASQKYKEEFTEHCALLKGIDPICYRVSGGFPKDVERYPHCVEAWPKIKAFGEFNSEIEEREKAIFRDLTRKDAILIESAGID